MIEFNKPLAVPPVKHWKYDLPGPNDPPMIYPNPHIISHAPNYVDDILLELPREEPINRGVGAYLLILAGLSMASIPITLITYVVMTLKSPPIMLTFLSMFTFTLGMWPIIYRWRIDTESPVDSPIRFNRARRRIYVYRFFFSGWHLFNDIKWGVKIDTYNWDDLHAEFSSTDGSMGTGIVIESVTLAVLEPNTNTVMDRFILAHRGHEAEMYWAMAQIFMQEGPQALPVFDKPPRDWNNERHFFNFARRFAPKVKWPEAMDLESRTAPFSIKD
jgi:hypothetical protein